MGRHIALPALPHVRLVSSALFSRLSVLSRSAQVVEKACDAELENRINFGVVFFFLFDFFFANLTC